MVSTEQGGSLKSSLEHSEAASRRAGEWAAQAAEKGKSFFSEQCRSTAEGINSAVGVLRNAAHDLEERNNVGAARLIESAADRLSGFAEGLHDKDLDRVLTDATAYARRNPWVFFAGAMAVGLIASRFLKSSAHREDFGPQEGSIIYPPGAGGTTRSSSMHSEPKILRPADFTGGPDATS
ncbi:MAG TPA: hypothetical protein VLA73_09275 [Burkholderiales bacterium]|nr:hypothetical protein [Burkholderiales bacterium]